MKRPLPPELLDLGEHLETAARRSLVNKHTRRNLVLNAVTSLAIAVPVAFGLISSQLAARSELAIPSAPPKASVETPVRGDFPPRVIRTERVKSSGRVLVLPTNLRWAQR